VTKRLETELEAVQHFRLGDWLVKPAEKSFHNGKLNRCVEPRAMDVLVLLSQHPGQVLSAEQLLIECWRGDFYGDNPVHKAIAQLRKVLGDRATQPKYIETIRKRGYRLIAPVVFPDGYAGAVPQHFNSWAQGSPYRGLSYFDADHSEVFFGRSAATAELINRIRLRFSQKQPFILILGPSGSGKTSLLRAGVLPLLMRDSGFEDLKAIDSAIMMTGKSLGSQPVLHLIQTIAEWSFQDRPVLSEADVAVLYEDVMAGRFEPLIAKIKAAIEIHRFALRDIPGSPFFVLMLDQFEQVCANPEITQIQKKLLIDLIRALIESQLVLVLAVSRNDFYPELMQLEGLSGLKSDAGHYDLLAPSLGEIAQMIRFPAQAAGLVFEQDPDTLLRLDDQIRDDALSRPQTLPLLQYTLHELYEQRDPNGQLSFDAYQSIGGLEGALSSRADTVFSGLSAEAQKALPSLLSRMVIQRGSGAISSRSCLWSGLTDAHEQTLAQALVDARLLVSELKDDVRILSVAHEALFTHWGRAKDWVRGNVQMLKAHRRLTVAAKRWEEETYSVDFLLAEGKPLKQSQSLLRSPQFKLTEHERSFIKKSATRVSQRRIFRMAAIALLIMLAVTVTITGIMAENAREEAEQRREQAESLVGFMLGDLSDRLRPLGRLNLLSSAADQAMQYLESLPLTGLNSEAILLRAQALTRVGEISLIQGNSDQATSALKEASTLLDTIHSEDSNKADYYQQAGTNEFWLGYLYFGENDLEQTGLHWLKYNEYAQQWVSQEPDNPDALLELSYALNNQGTLAIERAQLSQAEGFINQSIELKKRVISIKPDNKELKIELADSFSWAGNVAEKSGLLKSALNYYEREYSIIKQLLLHGPNNPEWTQRSVLAEMNLAQLSDVTGEHEQAQNQYTSALQKMDLLIKTDPSNKEWLEDHTFLQSRLADVLYRSHQLDQSRALIDQAIRRLREMAGSDELTYRGVRLRWFCLQVLAQIMRAQNENGQAGVLLEQAKSGLEILLAENPNDPFIQTSMAATLLQIGDLKCDNGSLGQAREYWQKVIDLLSGSIDQTRNHHYQALWIKARVRFGLEAETSLKLLKKMGYARSDLQLDLLNYNEETKCL